MDGSTQSFTLTTITGLYWGCAVNMGRNRSHPSHRCCAAEIIESVSYLIHGSVTNQALCVCEGYIAGRGSVALIIRNDLDPIILPRPHAAVSCKRNNTTLSTLRTRNYPQRETRKVSKLADKAGGRALLRASSHLLGIVTTLLSLEFIILTLHASKSGNKILLRTRHANGIASPGSSVTSEPATTWPHSAAYL